MKIKQVVFDRAKLLYPKGKKGGVASHSMQQNQPNIQQLPIEPNIVPPQEEQDLIQDARVPTPPIKADGGKPALENDTQVKEKASKEPETEKKIDELVQSSKRTLFRCSAVWPFDLFPNELSIDTTQVNIKQKVFFDTAKVMSIPIKNVADVIVTTSPFFATLQIIDSSYVQNNIQIPFLKKRDAEEARRIIQGLFVASKEGVDLLRLDATGVKRKLEEIGKAEFEN